MLNKQYKNAARGARNDGLGCRHLLSLKQFENIRFIQPKEFLEILDANAS